MILAMIIYLSMLDATGVSNPGNILDMYAKCESLNASGSSYPLWSIEAIPPGQVGMRNAKCAQLFLSFPHHIYFFFRHVGNGATTG